ncbi:MAG TPA: response regulator [Azospirillaceae bacterium]|nr:response regulator [Azospirillaceae bacterium]
MAEYEYGKLVVMLIDHEFNTRRLLRGILARYGIEKIHEYSSTVEATNALQTQTPDLIVVDADQKEGGDALKWVVQLRHNQLPASPFVPVVVLTWQPTQPLLVRFTGSGADDMLVKPFSQKQVSDRLQNLIEDRKKFVVTSDYVGPDRRRSPREGQQIPLVDVPNTLRLKAMGEYGKTDLNAEVEQALRAINMQKIVRHGFQIAFLAVFALPGLVADPPEKRAVDHLLRVTPVADDLLRRLPQGDIRGQAETYMKVLAAAVEAVRADPARPLEHPQAVHQAAIGLVALTSRRTDLPAVEQEVMAAVTAYRNRLEQLAQAKAAATPA